MKQFIGILLFAASLAGLSSCYNTSIPKPDELIPKDKFEKMMVDMYIVQGLTIGYTKPEALKKVTSTDLYFSVLKKYDVVDTVFIRSLIYYSSFPKDYEKMQLSIMNTLKKSEQMFKPKEKLNADPE
ncbi:MAG: DUF4296 domain-containing protein [Prolixibacteraceae bacterium]|jgi:hypothetical protein